ncbi:MAG: sugar phosphate nucleotidyltransferase [Terrimicrobiaceae bacterium]
MRAIILAGGKGTRLRPYTITLPKPLVPVGGEMPIIEVIIRQLAKAGFSRLTFAVNHKANLIRAYCGDGSQWGLKIDYSFEETPLSTIGPLTLIEDLPENFLVMNGDLLCDLDCRALLEHHIKNGNMVTVAAYKRSVNSDFGVLHIDGNGAVSGFEEKPVFHFDVSMGVYCINRSVISALERGVPYGFDNLMLDGIRDGMRIEAVPFSGYWLDIGRPEDYDLANQEFARLKELWKL